MNYNALCVCFQTEVFSWNDNQFTVILLHNIYHYHVIFYLTTVKLFRSFYTILGIVICRLRIPMSTYRLVIVHERQLKTSLI